MATNTKPASTKTAAKSAEKKTEAPAPSFAVEVAPDADVLKTTRTSKPNPLLEALQNSITMGKALQVSVASAEQGTEVENLLRRAAKTIGCGLSMRNTGTHVVFQGKAQKRERKYTSADIRTWAEENGATRDMLYPRIAKEVRKAFRQAHGIDKVDDSGNADN